MDAIARDLLGFAASMLNYPLPDDLPEIRIEPDLECAGKITWTIFRTVIELKRWNDLMDQSVLLHELVHYMQRLNDMPLDYDGIDEAEVEAITVQLRWLESKGIDPRTAISSKALLHMSKSEEFAKLEWLDDQ